MEEQSQEYLDNIDLNGSESFSGIEQDVNAEAVAEEGSSSQPVPPERGPVPYDRFAEVNAERNQLKEQVNQLVHQVQSISQNLQQKEQPQPNPATPAIETIEDLVAYVKQNVESDLKPVKETLRLEKIARGVESYFASNAEAAQLRNAMDEYTANIPEYRKAMILDSIERGDRSVMDEIFYTVKSRTSTNSQSRAAANARSEAASIGVNSSMRTIPRTAPTSGDLIRKGIETNDFSEYFSKFASQNLGIR